MNNALLLDAPVYPVVQVWAIDHRTGLERLVRPCCFHDLMKEDDMDLAGMGLTIIGNIVRGLNEGIINQLDIWLCLKVSPYGEPISLPWPGMPDNRPLPLNLKDFPMDYTMFLEKDGQFQRQPDRVALMNRIQTMWVPHLRKLIAVRA